jgi:hypothetical protein
MAQATLSQHQVAVAALSVRKPIQETVLHGRVQLLVHLMFARATHQDGVVPVVPVRHQMVRTPMRITTTAQAMAEPVQPQLSLTQQSPECSAFQPNTPVVAVVVSMLAELQELQVSVAALVLLVRPTRLVPESQTQAQVAAALATSTRAGNKLVAMVAAAWLLCAGSWLLVRFRSTAPTSG